jgi:SanA protein
LTKKVEKVFVSMNKRRLRIIKYAAISAAVTVLLWGMSAIAVYAVSSGRVFESASIDTVPRHRVAVVMGCVRTLANGLNNLYFSRRIDAAAELYKAGKVDAIIVSGDNHVKGYDEPSDMKESLVKVGVPADRIVCDYAGFRTLDTVVRAKKVFGLNSFIIVSQPDHVRRAVFTARGFGCDAYGFAAKDVNGRYSIKTTIREQLAKIAAVADVICRRSPKFLGPRETLPPPVEESDDLIPPDDCEPTFGTVAVNPSVYNVLWWLKAHQQKNGSWNDGPCPVASTSLAVCALLSCGEYPGCCSPYKEDFQDMFKLAAEYLLGCVSVTNGVVHVLGSDKDERALPLVTMALCDIYGVTLNPNFKGHAAACLRQLTIVTRALLASGVWGGKEEVLLWSAEALLAGKWTWRFGRFSAQCDGTYDRRRYQKRAGD